MPIYMDIHFVPGVNAKDVAEAHRQDLFHQEQYQCKCMTYWIDEQRGTIFCLIDAPDKASVEHLHGEAHGMLPNKIIEVSPSIVQSFLGRIYDPADATTTADGLTIFSDPSFRILAVTKMADPVLLRHSMGRDKAGEIVKTHNDIIRKNMLQHGGSEVEHAGIGFIISFTAAAKAVSFAKAVQQEMDSLPGELEFRIAINAGEPVEQTDTLFGNTIQLAKHLCNAAGKGKIAISSPVKELVEKDHLHGDHPFVFLSPQDEQLLVQLYDTLQQHWQDTGFDADAFCQAMAMSKSQLYRKTIALTGVSPNLLIKEFRLDQAREMMRKQFYNISQVTFDAGFTSPSYFTKCFKKQYGLLPMHYTELLQ